MKTRLLVPAVVAGATISLFGIPTAANAQDPIPSPSPSASSTETTAPPSSTPPETTPPGPANDDPADDEFAVVETPVSNADFTNPDVGAQITGANLKANAQYTLVLKDADGQELREFTTTTNAEGAFAHKVYGSPASTDFSGDYTVDILDGDTLLETVSFTVGDATDDPTDDPTETATPTETPSETEAPEVERAITITPEEIDVDDFVNEEEGVAIVVTGLEPGEDATLSVDPEPENVSDFELTETVAEDGTAAFAVYGTNTSSPEVYLGTYDVVVSADSSEDGLTGSFEVVDGAGNGGGNGDDDDEAGNGGQLPRTGTEMTGLALGAGLLVLGAGTVLVTRRRAKKQDIGEA